MKIDENIGQTYNMLTIIKKDISKGTKNKYYFCNCSCGNTKSIRFNHLKNGAIKSCGCSTSEMIKEGNTKHGMYNTPFYRVWDGIKTRCNNENDPEYHNYGGRGISYDPKWEDFIGFYEDMYEEYLEGLSIERIDVNGNYDNKNCTWITMFEQQQNKRNTFYVKYQGKDYVFTNLLRELDLYEDRLLIYKRLKRGWNIEKALFTERKQ